MRQDLYTGIHRAIRKLVLTVADHVQTADLTSPAERRAIAAEVAECLDMVAEHARHEAAFIHPALRAVDPELVATLEREHAALDALERPIRDALADEPAALDRAFARWVGAQLQHLAAEEELALPATQRHFDDPQLVAMRTQIQRDTAPARYAVWLRWLARGTSVPELGALLAAIQGSAPPDIAAQVVAIVAAER